MATNQVSSKLAKVIKQVKVAQETKKTDTGAAAAMKELEKNNKKSGSISGQEMMDAILKGTKDLDNNAAGSEFGTIQRWVEKNGAKLSPEAKKVYEAYAKAAKKAQASGQTGIDFRDYQAMQREMRSVSTGKPQDASAGKALAELAKDNKTPGSISGQEMANAIINGTKDLDGQAAGKEFADIAKFVRENEHLLSPEAKKAFAVYEKAVKAAKAAGQTGIPVDKFARMVRDMMRAAQPPTTSQPHPATPAPAPSAPPAQPPAGQPTQPAPTQPPAQPPAQPPVTQQPPVGGAPPPPFAMAPDDPNANYSIPVYQLPEQQPPVTSQPPVTTTPAAPVPVPVPVPNVPVGGDASATAALKELSAGNTKPGSVSGAEFVDAVIKGTKDLDNQAAGREYQDVAKWVKENGHLMSPEAKKAWAIYEKQAKAAQAKGQTGITLGEYNKMEKEMRAAAKPAYTDPSSKGALEALAKGNTTPGSISAKEMTDAILRGTRDLDNQAAGKEYADIAKFVRENEHLLSPEAKKAYATYEKYAKAAQGKGQTGITISEYGKMEREMRAIEKKPLPVVHDASAKKALDALGKANTKPGSISGEEMTKAIINGTKDLDNQAAGREFAEISKWVKANESKLSPEAKKAYEVYAKHAQAQQKKGQTGIPVSEFNKMEKEMLAASKPKYQDRTTAAALQGLAKGNTTPGSISAKELTDAIVKGTRDLDNQAAGKEYADIAKFVRENEHLLSPEAKKAFAVYEKAAKAAKGNDMTGIPLGDYNKMIRDMRALEQKPRV